MIEPIAFLLTGVALLYVGGEGLVRGSSALAQRMGMTPLLAGLTIVAFGTSAPEMVVSAKAAFMERGDIAAGNVVGSNIFNIAFILGLTCVIHPLKVQLQILRFDAPVMVGAVLALVACLADGRVSRVEGALLLAGIGTYIVAAVRMAHKEGVSAAVEKEFDEGVPRPGKSVWLEVMFVVGGIGLLVLGSRFFVDGAVAISRAVGVSEAVIGLTVVAAGTSLPELAASVVAAAKKQPDIALGNVVGSNIFNVFAIMGVAALVNPVEAPGMSLLDLWYMVGVAVFLVPFLWTELVLKRWEGGLLLATYGLYLFFLWPQ